jgi:hypothetical protein
LAELLTCMAIYTVNLFLAWKGGIHLIARDPWRKQSQKSLNLGYGLTNL